MSFDKHRNKEKKFVNVKKVKARTDQCASHVTAADVMTSNSSP